jgi:hypothetical protein
VAALSFLGAVTRLTLDHPEEGPLLADVLSTSSDSLRVGDHVSVAVRTGTGSVMLA